MSGYDEGAGSLGTATGPWGFDLGAFRGDSISVHCPPAQSHEPNMT